MYYQFIKVNELLNVVSNGQLLVVMYRHRKKIKFHYLTTAVKTRFLEGKQTPSDGKGHFSSNDNLRTCSSVSSSNLRCRSSSNLCFSDNSIAANNSESSSGDGGRKMERLAWIALLGNTTT